MNTFTHREIFKNPRTEDEALKKDILKLIEENVSTFSKGQKQIAA